jgi:ankyrin repeat protein
MPPLRVPSVPTTPGVMALTRIFRGPNSAANATDKSGVTPLHRAVRTRCAAAVKALLEGRADPRRKNKSGSSPMLLATQNTGRGGSGSCEAKAQQELILQLLQEHINRQI